MRLTRVQHQFVERIPEILEEGYLYISINRKISVHSCFCGCGNKVVLSLSPSSWYMIYNGEDISLSPSIGNITLPCLSHYYITNNYVEWLPKMRKLAKKRSFDFYLGDIFK